jgi:hypothetical protein
VRPYVVEQPARDRWPAGPSPLSVQALGQSKTRHQKFRTEVPNNCSPLIDACQVYIFNQDLICFSPQSFPLEYRDLGILTELRYDVNFFFEEHNMMLTRATNIFLELY